MRAQWVMVAGVVAVVAGLWLAFGVRVGGVGLMVAGVVAVVVGVMGAVHGRS